MGVPSFSKEAPRVDLDGNNHFACSSKRSVPPLEAGLINEDDALMLSHGSAQSGLLSALDCSLNS